MGFQENFNVLTFVAVSNLSNKLSNKQFLRGLWGLAATIPPGLNTESRQKNPTPSLSLEEVHLHTAKAAA